MTSVNGLASVGSQSPDSIAPSSEYRQRGKDQWLILYVDSWDTNGAASFSQRFGYMDKGHDFDGTIAIADKALD